MGAESAHYRLCGSTHHLLTIVRWLLSLSAQPQVLRIRAPWIDLETNRALFLRLLDPRPKWKILDVGAGKRRGRRLGLFHGGAASMRSTLTRKG